MAKYTYNPPYNQWSGNRSDTLNKWKINYKGSIATASVLPDEGEFKGDTYNVLEDGSNYMWNGTSWDKLDANTYVGATFEASGIRGLVPPATTAQMYSLLTGMGTWQSAEDLGLALDNEVVHLTGDETIEGVKTFQNSDEGVSSKIIVKSTDIVKGTPITPSRNNAVVFADSTDNDPNGAGRLASVAYHAPVDEDSAYYTLLRCNNYYGSGYSDLRVGYDGDNVPYATAPETSDERTNSIDIVTRGYMEASEWNWQKTKKAGAVTFKPAPESDLEPVVDFMFTETPPAEGDKGPENPSTISGVSSVNVGRIGKNLLLQVSSTQTAGSITMTPQIDGSYVINGTSSSAQYFAITDSGVSFGTPIYSSVILNTNKSYTLSAKILEGTFSGGLNIALGYSTGSGNYKNKSVVNGIASIVLDSTYFPSGRFMVRIGISENSSFSNVKVVFQLEEGDTVTDFEAPMIPADANYTIQLGDTYYGGSLDVATGVMTVAWAADNVSAFSTVEYLDTNIINFRFNTIYNHAPRYDNVPDAFCCNRFMNYSDDSAENEEYARFSGSVGSEIKSMRFYIAKSRLDVSAAVDPNNPTNEEWLQAAHAWLSSNPTMVSYKLATPQTVQLTPTQIRSLPALDKYEPRINTVYSDQEAVQVGYQRYSDESRLAALEARIEALEASQG